MPAADHPGLDNKELTSKLGELWRGLGGEEKKQYEVRRAIGASLQTTSAPAHLNAAGPLDLLSYAFKSANMHQMLQRLQDSAAADKQRYDEEVEAAGPQPKKPRAPKVPHTKVRDSVDSCCCCFNLAS